MGMIIAFGGKKSVGKTTAAMELKNSWGFEVVSFSTPMKDMMAAMGLSDAELRGHLKEAPCALLGGKTPRYALETLGTEWARNLITPDLWVNCAKRRILDLLEDGHDVVVDDVRFKNEANMIESLSGHVIKILRPSVTDDNDHESNMSNFNSVFCIENEGELRDFTCKILKAYEYVDALYQRFDE